MALENNEVLQTLMERKTTLEQQIQEGNMQLQQMTSNLLKITGAVEVLQQIEASGGEVPEGMDDIGEEPAPAPEGEVPE
jgi:prefoldin subunit 5